MLDPNVLAQVYTAAEIEANITTAKAAYDAALENKRYSLDDMQSKQSVESQDLKDLADNLTAWLRAKAIQNGITGPKLYSITYTGGHN